jgi:hypothetical protein
VSSDSTSREARRRRDGRRGPSSGAADVTNQSPDPEGHNVEPQQVPLLDLSIPPEHDGEAGPTGPAAAERPAARAVEEARGRPPVQAAPPPASIKLSPGDELEMRLARLWFWEGSFSRRGINLQQHFTDENFTITDLDLLAFEITGQLSARRGIGEAKSGTGKDAPKPMDRCLWLAGVARLVQADSAEYVTALKVSRKIRETAARLSVRPMTIDDLTQREKASGMDAVLDVGSHGPTAMAKAKFAAKHARNDRHWERAFWFVRCEVWFLEPWHAVKRSIGLLDSLANWWTPDIDDDDQALLRWLYAVALGVFTLNAVLLAGHRLGSEKNEWRGWARDRLAEGAVPMHQMRVLSDAVDKYVAGLLGRLKAPVELQVETIGTFLPTVPDWADGLLELVERLAADPATTRDLPRHVDLVVHERLVHRRHVDPVVLGRVDRGQSAELDKLRRQVTAFLRGNARLPEAVDKALGTTTSS